MNLKLEIKKWLPTFWNLSKQNLLMQIFVTSSNEPRDLSPDYGDGRDVGVCFLGKAFRKRPAWSSSLEIGEVHRPGRGGHGKWKRECGKQSLVGLDMERKKPKWA